MSLLIKGQEHHIFGSPDTCFNSLMTWVGSGSKLASHGLLEWWRTDSWRGYHYGVSTPLWNSNAPESFFGTSSLQSGHPNRIVFLSVCMTGSSSVVFGSRGRLSQLILIVLKRSTPKIKKDVSAPKCQFSPAGQSLIQTFLEPFEHNLCQKSSIKRLFQPTVGPISALGPNQP